MQKEIKYNGFTATPSDYESPDGDLAAVINLVPEDGQLNPILPATQLFKLPIGYRPIFIHKSAAFTHPHYIIRYDDTTTTPATIKLYWINEPSTYTEYQSAYFIDSGEGKNLLHTFTSIHEVNAIGNTIVVLADDSMHYFLWKQDNYNYLGTHLPETIMHFSLSEPTEVTSTKQGFGGNYRTDHWEFIPNEGVDPVPIVTEKTMAELNKQMNNEIIKEGHFGNPFYVRYAYRLYDGTSLVMHSAPLFMSKGFECAVYYREHPSPITQTGYIKIEDKINGKLILMDGANWIYKIKKCDLKYIMSPLDKSKLQDWSDIISSVDIFISQPFYLYDQAGKVESIKFYTYEDEDEQHWEQVDLVLPTIERQNEEIEECGNFYLVKSIPIDEIETSIQETLKLKGKLEGLVSREVMTDDYDSHDTLIPKHSFLYNSRLNIANLSKKIFAGFPLDEWPFEAGTDKMKMAITYETPQKSIVVTIDEITNFTIPDKWYYYNPNAYPATLKIVKETDSIVSYRTIKLKSHAFLNGFYAVIEIRGAEWHLSGEDFATTCQQQLPTPTADSTIALPNKIYTSAVNNPFYFPKTGINTIGTGEISGICAAVKAMSIAQYGQFPLYAFTDEGVWTLEVAKDGTFGTIPPPVTRDVCIYPKSITQLDSTVLFATERGIMMLSGSSSICISEVLDSTNPFTIEQLPNSYALAGLNGFNVFDFNHIPFRQFIKECRMIYDYTNQRIIVFNPSTETVSGETRRRYTYAYVYSLKSKQWGMMKNYLNDNINSYPDALAFTDYNTVVNLSDPDEDAVLQGVRGMLITRPLKLDEPDVLKTIDTIIQRGYFRKGSVSCVLLGSRDLFNWQIIYSSSDHYLRGFRGTPYKYFRLVIYCDMQKDESLFGCTVQYTPRLTDQPR